MPCVVFARPHREPEQTLNDPLVDCPYISLLVAAKNEEAVIGKRDAV